ncbi:hypothetical protein D3C81_392350 [compost metagenome]
MAGFLRFMATTPGEHRSPKPSDEGSTPSGAAKFPMGLEDLSRGRAQVGRVDCKEISMGIVWLCMPALVSSTQKKLFSLRRWDYPEWLESASEGRIWF